MNEIKLPVHQLGDEHSAIMDADNNIVASALTVSFAKEIIAALNAPAEHDKYRDACERLIGHYGEMGFKISGRYDTAGDEVGLFARQVKAELEGIEGSEIEVGVE